MDCCCGCDEYPPFIIPEPVIMFLISNFRRVPNVAFFLLGDSPSSKFCDDVSEHSVSSIFIGGVFFLLTPPVKMVLTGCSETSVHKIQTSGNHPKERIQQVFTCLSSLKVIYSEISSCDKK